MKNKLHISIIGITILIMGSLLGVFKYTALHKDSPLFLEKIEVEVSEVESFESKDIEYTFPLKGFLPADYNLGFYSLAHKPTPFSFANQFLIHSLLFQHSGLSPPFFS